MLASPDPVGGSLGSMTQQLLDDTHFLVDQARVWRSICSAIRFHHSNRLWFSGRQFEFAVTAGRDQYAPGDGYGLPADLVEIVGNRLYLHYAGVANQPQFIYYLTPAEYDLRREWDTAQGTPLAWTFENNRLKLTPSPNNSADTITGPYVRNIGVPKFSWNGTSYDFFTPEGKTLTGDYTNDWFQWLQAEQMIRLRAQYELQRNLKDPEAQETLGAWLEAKTRMEDEEDAKTAGGMTRLVARLF